MTLLKAVAEVAKATEDWRLLIIGEGPERARLEAFVNSHRWNRQVRFLGSSSRVPELLNALDVYVLPSVSEGISNSLLEAMSTGVAALATNVGGNPEVIVNGESGLLFPVRDSNKLAEQLLRLKDGSEHKRSLGQQARQRVREEFSIESMVQKYEEMYQSLRTAGMYPIEVAAGV
jgi:glycosyltransferase involved in cell wall biosynthesis